MSRVHNLNKQTVDLININMHMKKPGNLYNNCEKNNKQIKLYQKIAEKCMKWNIWLNMYSVVTCIGQSCCCDD